MGLPREDLIRLSQPRLWRWLLAWGVHVGLIAGALALARAVDHPLAYAAAVPWVSGHLHGIAVLGHDGAHWNATRNKRLNDALTNALCFLPFGFPLRRYRAWHLDHHRHLGSPLDPELSTIKRWRQDRYTLPVTPGRLRARVLRGMLGGDAPDLLMLARLFGPETAVEVATTLAVFAALGGAVYALSLAWVVPVLAACMLLQIPVYNALRTQFEHCGTPSTHRLRLGPLARFFLGPHHVLEYHFEHHAWPSVPFYNLPETRAYETTTPVISLAALRAWMAAPDRASAP